MNAHPEAAGRLSPALREDSTVPWARVIAFRNRLIHGYWSIDLHLVWDVIENELPDAEGGCGPVARRTGT